MTNPPTGRIVPTADGNELIVSRTFRASIQDVGPASPNPIAPPDGSEYGKATPRPAA